MTPLTFVLFFIVITLTGILLVESVYGFEYEIEEITHQYKLFKDSRILKTQGYTTTGEMFFLRESPTFTKLMILDLNGKWLKDATIKEKSIEVESDIIITQPDVYLPKLGMIIQHDFTTYWKQDYDVYVKVYDLNINSFPKIYPFEGKVIDAEVLVNISFEDKIIDSLNGISEFGEFHGKRFFPDSISIPGKYDVEVIVSYSGQIIKEKLEMFVIGEVPDSSTKKSIEE